MPIRRLLPVLLAASLLLLIPVAGAHAGNMVIWGSSSAIGVAPTAGGSGSNIFTSATTNIGYPFGTAVDPAAGKVYWINSNDGTLYSANLDGSGTPTLVTNQNISSPYGLALDPTTQRLYWGNDGSYDIGWVTTDGTASGILYAESTTPQATTPHAPAVDPVNNRIYWANSGASPPHGGKIGYAKLDGTGGAGTITLSGTCSPFDTVYSVAVDTKNQRLYASGAGTIGGFNGRRINIIADLDGSGCTDISTVRDETAEVYGLAVDPDVGRLIGGFWYDPAPGVGIKAWNLSTIMAGFSPMNVGSALSDYATFPVVVGAPRGTPSISPAAPELGATLTCAANWSIGEPSMQFYASPRGATTYAWKRDGLPIAGATGATLSAAKTGDYTCDVTASNAAGTATMSSPSKAVTLGSAVLRLTTKTRSIVARRARTTFEVRVRNGGPSPAYDVRTCVTLGKGFKLKAQKGVTLTSRTACWTVARLAKGRTVTKRLTLTAPAQARNAGFAVTTRADNAKKRSTTARIAVR